MKHISTLRAAVAVALLIVLGAEAPAQSFPDIRIGQSVRGTVSPDGPTLNWRGAFTAYRFDAAAGGRYEAQAQSSDFTPGVQLYRLVGGITELVHEGYMDEYGSDAARMRFRTEAAGPHLLLVQAQEAGSGGLFTLSLAERAPLRPCPPQALTVGRAVNGTITDDTCVFETEWDQEIAADLYGFQARAGEHYRIALDSDDFDAYLEFGALFGEQFDVREADDDGGEGLNSLLIVRIPANGTYGVRARPLGEFGRGAYTLRVEAFTPQPPRRQAIRAGQTVSAQITAEDARLDSGVSHHVWTYEGRAGERLAIRMRSDEFDAYLSFGQERNGVFEELAYNDDAPDDGLNSLIEYTLPAAGTYVIHARPLGTGRTGAYTLEVQSGR